MSRRPAFPALAFALAVALAAPPAYAQKGKPSTPPPPDVTFDLVLLGTLGGANCDARAVSDAGVIVGRADTPVGGTYREAAFVRYPGDGLFRDLNDALDLTQKSQWHLDFAEDVNDLGQVLGYGGYDPDGPDGPQPRLGRTGFRLKRNADGTVAVVPLRDPAGTAAMAEPAAMNNQGDVAGWYGDETGLFNAGVFTAEGAFVRIGNLGGRNTFPWALTDRDASGRVRVVGEAGSPVRAWQAFVYPATGAAGPPQDLGVPYTGDGADALARAVNNRGEVVGEATFSSGNNFAGLYTDAAGWKNLGTLANPKAKSWNNSWAAYVNDNGWVVGGSLTGNVRDVPNSKGFLWRPGVGMRDLEAMVNGLPADLVGRLAVADVNDNNVMCGSQTAVAGTNQVYLLLPKAP